MTGVQGPEECVEMTRTKKQSTEAAVREIRWFVDLRPRARIFSVPGLGALKSEENTKAVLEHIRGEVYRGVPIEQVVAEYLSPRQSRIESRSSSKNG